MKTNGLFLGAVCNYNSNNASLDKHGLAPVIIEALAGSCPNKRVISGTVAKNMGIEVGSTYIFKFTMLEEDPEYGSQYSFLSCGLIDDPMKILDIEERLGSANIIGE